MSHDSAWLPSEIADQLTELKTWVRWQWLLRGVGRVCLIASLGLAGAFFADYRYDLAPTTRIAVLSSIATVTLVTFLVWVVVPMCRRIGWAELAAMADKANPRWEDALTSAVELFDPKQPDGFKGSPVMREMLLKQTRQRMEELDLEQVVSSRRAWSSVRWGLASCLLLAIPVFVAPSMYRQLWQRFLVPWGNWGTAGVWSVAVENGDRIVARGTDVELLATAVKDGQAEPPKSLTLEWRDTAGTADRRTMTFDKDRKNFVALVPHVMRDFDFRVVVERQKSRDYKIQVVEPPVVTKIRLDVEPPAYSGWPAQSLDGAIGAIKVFEKSRLTFTLEFNKPVESAQLVWRQHGDANKKLDLAASKQSASLELTADSSVAGPFLFAIEDIHKLPNNDTVPRELIIVTDEAPKLTVKGDHSTEARPDDVVPIDVAASDDVGLGTMELQLTVENAPREPFTVEAVRGQKQFEHRFTLDFSQLNVEHGQWLSYRVRITDERPEPGPHEVLSELRVLRISKKAAPPGASDLAKLHEQLKDELNDLRRDIDAKKGELADLRKEAVQTKKKDAPPDGEHVAQLQRELQELTKRTEQLAKQLANDPLFHELGEKAEQVAQNELKQAIAEVEKSRSEVDQKLTPDQLGHVREAEKNLEAASKKLAQLEKPFDQLADLQKDLLELRRLARQAEQLANRADELAKNEASKPETPAKDASDANQPEASARDDKQAAAEAAKTEQEKQQLADQQKQLGDALNDLLKRRPELLAAARRDQLEQLGELAAEAKQLAEQQKELAAALRQQQEAAAERNEELAEKQRMPANDQSPEAEKPQPKIPPGDKADQKKNEEQPDKNEEDPEDRKIVLTIRLFNQDRESLDVGEYAKRRGLDEPLFRETILQRYDYRATEFGITDSVTPTMAWHSPVSLPFVAKKFEGKKFELFQVRAVAGSFLEITRFEPELVKFDLYSIKSDLPIASLSNELVPEDMELRPGLARLTNWARELAKDSDGTPEGITRRLRDELQTRGGFRYMQRNAVLANQDKPLDVEDFLFNEKQKRGHCEYFADALTLMLRSVNIPARTIGGLKGGEYQAGDINNRAGYLLMQKKHGHAWVEAHLNGRWQTVDGTPGGSNGVGQPLAAESSGEQPQVNPGQDPQVAQQVRETQQAQRQLTQEAQQLQKQVEQELGKDSPEAKQSQQTARLCES